mgnify:FL=1
MFYVFRYKQPVVKWDKGFSSVDEKPLYGKIQSVFVHHSSFIGRGTLGSESSTMLPWRVNA